MKTRLLTILMIFIASVQAQAADVNRHLSMELDPLSPAAALREQNKGNPTSMWGGSADFNLGRVSTGPEFWIGTFKRAGQKDCSQSTRLDSYDCGESFKADATRLRWTVAFWESSYTMRGWYLKAGYSYTKIVSKIDRNNYMGAVDRFNAEGDSVDSNITDLRQGMMLGFGQRWAFWEQKATLTVGASYTANLSRTVSVDSEDPLAEEDYNRSIENIQDTRMSSRAVPELNLGVGYLW